MFLVNCPSCGKKLAKDSNDDLYYCDNSSCKLNYDKVLRGMSIEEFAQRAEDNEYMSDGKRLAAEKKKREKREKILENRAKRRAEEEKHPAVGATETIKEKIGDAVDTVLGRKGGEELPEPKPSRDRFDYTRSMTEIPKGEGDVKVVRMRDLTNRKEYVTKKMTRKSGLEAKLEGITCPNCREAIIKNTNIRTDKDYEFSGRHMYWCGNCNHKFIYIDYQPPPLEYAISTGTAPPEFSEPTLPPHEEPPEEPHPPEESGNIILCPHCSYRIQDVKSHIPSGKNWNDFYKKVGRGERKYDWIFCPSCEAPAIIVGTDDDRPLKVILPRKYRKGKMLDFKREKGEKFIFIRYKKKGVIGLSIPNYEERLQIEEQLARYKLKHSDEIEKQYKKVKKMEIAMVSGAKIDPAAFAAEKKKYEDALSEYNGDFGSAGIDGKGNLVFHELEEKLNEETGKMELVDKKDEDGNLVFNSGYLRKRLKTRISILKELGVSDEEIDEMIDKSRNTSDFEKRAKRKLGFFDRRKYIRESAERDLNDAEKSGLSGEEIEKRRKKLQQDSSPDLGFFSDMGKRVGNTGQRMMGAFMMIIVGVVLAAFLQDQLFFWGMLCWSFRTILPSELGNINYTDDILKRYSKSAKKAIKTGEEGDIKMSPGGTGASRMLSPLMPLAMGFRASMMTRDNRRSSGLASLKVILKVAAIVLIGLGLYQSAVPMAGVVYMIFVFASYYSLPITYDVENPEEFLGSIFRFLLGFFVPFSLMGMFGEGSGILFWISLAFLLVFPVAKTKSEAKALNMAVTAGESHREMFDKLIFILIMVVVLLVFMGWLNIGAFPGFEGTSNTVFWACWGVGLFAGILSPAEVRPYTGMIVIAIVFLLFTAGPGQQAVGSAFLGQWWPAFHNAVSTVTSPFGEIFGTLQDTFGSTFLLMTNPVGYANQIMEGGYEKNPTGKTGAYGVELDSVKIPVLYPGTPAMATFNVKNVGPVDGKDVRVFLEVPIKFKDVVNLTDSDGTRLNAYTEDDEYASYIIPYGDEEAFDMDLNDVRPFFFMMNSECIIVMQRKGDRDYQYETRDLYIPFRVRVEYNYMVNSWIPLEVISGEEWERQTTEGRFDPVKVISHISTSPAKLSLGTFDQPIVENRPLYIGFNLSSAEGDDSAIVWDWKNPRTNSDEYTTITLGVPDDFSAAFEPGKCIPFDPARSSGDTYVWEYDNELYRGKSVFCTDNKGVNIDTPSATFFINASATFRFTSWEEVETRFAFSDVCDKEDIYAKR